MGSYYDKIAALEGKPPFKVAVSKDSQFEARLKLLEQRITDDFGWYGVRFDLDRDALKRDMRDMRMKSGKRLFKAITNQRLAGRISIQESAADPVTRKMSVMDFLKSDTGVKIVANIGEFWERTAPVTMPIYVDVVEGLPWKQGDFGDYKSCFWSERPDARNIMKAIGVYSVRLMTDDFDAAFGILDKYSHAGEVYSIESIKEQMRRRAIQHDGLYGFGRALVANVVPYDGTDNQTGALLVDRTDWGIRRNPETNCVTVFNSYPKLWRLWQVAHILATVVGAPIITEIDTAENDTRVYINNNRSILLGETDMSSRAHISMTTYSVGRKYDNE